MPLRIVRSGSNAELWNRCRDELLSEIGTNPGPTGFRSHLWVAHRGQRDALFQAAAERGLPGWLAPPFAFLSELRERFHIRQRPVGHLTGRLLVSRVASREFRRAGLGSGRPDRGPAGSHAIDGLFSELLPEGITPDELGEALARLGGDDFAVRRNRWVEASYRSFLQELESLDRYDPRSIHAMVARSIEAGSLPDSIGGAGSLHIYGLTSLKGRKRLFRALAAQPDVEVTVYLTREPGESEWDGLLAHPSRQTILTGAPPPGRPVMFEAADAQREAEWVAARVRSALHSGEMAPHRVAIVLRSGGEDTGRIVRALDEVGVPSTSRARWRLSDIAALRALLLLFRGAAEDWDYRSLRNLVASPFFGGAVDLRVIDFISRQKRVRGLEEWRSAIGSLVKAASDEDRAAGLAAEGIYSDRLQGDVAGLEALAARLRPLSGACSEREWIEHTLAILEGRRFEFRRRLSEPSAERYDLVRADQRGVEALQELLSEWRELRPSDDSFGPEEWLGRLQRLLDSNEIALTSPDLRGVQVLEAHEAALGSYEQSFIVHANDGVFPRPFTNRGVFSEAETARLKELGLPLAAREDFLRRELALWSAVTSLDAVVFVSRAASSDGNPRSPSLWIPGNAVRWAPASAEEAESAGPPGTISRARMLEREADLLVRSLRAGAAAPFESIDAPALRQAILAAWSEDLRAGRMDGPPSGSEGDRPSMRPHPWGGLLRDPVVVAHLEERFGEGYVWSASQLEQYGRRPFDFLLDRVLRLQASEEAEDTTSPASRGSLAHSILDRFFRGLVHGVEREMDRPTELSGEALALYERVAAGVLDEAERSDDFWLGEPALWQVTREQIVESVRGFLERELPRLDKEGAWPVRLELGFGGEGEPEFVLHGRDLQDRPGAMRVRGRIDRVDAKPGNSGTELRILDYKWGSYPPARGYRDGSVLQLPIYMQAVSERADFEGRVSQGSYRPVTRDTANGALIRAKDVDPVLAFALSIAGRVRRGLFEPVQAASMSLGAWQVGPEVTRSTAKFRDRHRFEPASEPGESESGESEPEEPEAAGKGGSGG
jgi:RecB family exonuclease